MEKYKSVSNDYDEEKVTCVYREFRGSVSSEGSSSSMEGETTLFMDELDLEDEKSMTLPKVKSWSFPTLLTAFHYLRNAIIDLLLCLLPSFIYPWRPKTTAAKKSLHPTAYLDGLRGVASLIVVFYHHKCQYVPALLEGYGSEHDNYWILQLPLIRIIHSGDFMVHIFYVLSGYVLSARGLKLARQGRQSEFCKSLSSSVARRWLRLMLPVAASLAVAMVISHFSLWKIQPGLNWLGEVTPRNMSIADLPSNETMPLNITILPPTPRFVWLKNQRMPVSKDWRNQTSEFAWVLFLMGDPLTNGRLHEEVTPYNAGGVLWTIPAEWYGSMVVFIVTVGVAWLRDWARAAVIAFLAIYCQYMSRWESAQFISGMFLAELALIREASNQNTISIDHELDLPTYWAKCKTSLPTSTLSTYWQKLKSASTTLTISTSFQTLHTTSSNLLSPTTLQALRNLLTTTLFTLGLYLGSTPYLKVSTSPGFITLWTYTRQNWFLNDSLNARFLHSIGSILVVGSLGYNNPLQAIFTTSLARYLGRISFALYLCHSQVIWTVGNRVFPWAMRVVGGGAESQTGFLAGMVLGAGVCLPIIVWVADVFTRVVDERAVGFARWIGERMLDYGD